MPTKHKRKRDDDKSFFDLPPTTKAKSLPVIAPTKDFLTPKKKQKLNNGKAKKSKGGKDDTPKAFARLMAWHKDGKKIAGGLDDGTFSKPKKTRKQKPAQHDTSIDTTTVEDSESQLQPSDVSGTVPKIQRGESLAEFAIRVDQSLPLASLAKQNINPNKSLPEDLREKEKKSRHVTKHNKRLMRMQSEWRNTEAKLKAKEEEEAEDNMEKVEEDRLLWDSVKTTGKKGKKKVVDDDPWKELEKKRREEEGRRGKGHTIGLSARDQVQAPPTLGAIKNIFKERPVAGNRLSRTNNLHFKTHQKPGSSWGTGYNRQVEQVG